MSATRPDVSVVVATHERRDRLAKLLAALRAQTLAAERFEVVVVDDGSSDGTWELLEREAAGNGTAIRPLRAPRSEGPAAARNRGWREARGDLVAFTDDDCVPEPGWLAAGIEACAGHPGAIVQGQTLASAEDRAAISPLARPFTHAVEVRTPDPHFQTCNVFYPRALLERTGGFDEFAFGRVEGEDADLAWRAIGDGAETGFAERARVVHARVPLGPLGKLRRAARWDLKVYALHRGLRERWFTRAYFWQGSHYLLARAIVAALLPRRLLPIRVWLALPYLVHLMERGRVEGGGPVLAPYFVLNDLIEMGAGVRASLRYRVPML